MRINGFAVDYWYRHSSDDDRTVRTHCQMSAHADSSDDITKRIAELRAGDYEVQRVKVHTVCPKCQSNGRIVVKVYKRQPAKYADCPVCQSTGFVGSIEYPINPVDASVDAFVARCREIRNGSPNTFYAHVDAFCVSR